MSAIGLRPSALLPELVASALRRLPAMPATVVMQLLMIVLPAHAESFLGLEPLQTLASVRQRFPDAKLDPEHPPWLKPNQYYALLDTDGADGMVALLFEHDDDKRRQKLVDLQKSLPSTVNNADNSNAKSINLLIRQQREALARPLEERLSLVRIRWIPEKPARLAALQARYGRPDSIQLRQGNPGPVYVWDRGVHAYLSSDRKQAKMIEFWFTEDDLAEVFLKR